MSSIDFNVTTKRNFWGVFEGIYYNPYYKKERPNRGEIWLRLDMAFPILDEVDDLFIHNLLRLKDWEMIITYIIG
jgi:hypothetical protein